MIKCLITQPNSDKVTSYLFHFGKEILNENYPIKIQFMNLEGEKVNKINVESYLKKQDPKIYQAICGEIKRQQEGMELIASENFNKKEKLNDCLYGESFLDQILCSGLPSANLSAISRFNPAFI